MKRVALAALALFVCAPIASCSSKAPDATPDAGSPSPLVVARPYTIYQPDSYDPSKPTPFVFMLHGYGAGGAAQEALFQITVAAKKYGFLYGYGDGTPDSRNHRFWNATDACCDLDHMGVDDVAYLDAVIDDVERLYNVDKKRVYFIGHSNGGFMSHRMACDRASRIAAIVSLAGAQWKDPSRCQPSEPVSVLQVHGDKDDEILYDGGSNTDSNGVTTAYPSAHETVATWAAKDGCTQPHTQVGTIDVDANIAGDETTVERYGGCNNNADVELWTVHGAGHVPGLSSSWAELVWGFMSAHPKQ
jgi:polyhydroxybutyrate depolymerase